MDFEENNTILLQKYDKLIMGKVRIFFYYLIKI
jgi:hypothetical protein